MAEPVTLVSKTIPFSFPLAQPFTPPPHERVLAKLGRQAARLNLEAFRTKRHGHTIFSMSRLPSVCQLSCFVSTYGTVLQPRCKAVTR